ncbi:L,D-transpeptidase family protein [Streptomyces sp. Rer75]|uniref:L,D-transpeptidase family protein n=1 Tax=unclassified Streptomyces TaxID=2593676 RepID=UPI00211E922E|nr:L,D-transpeptidase family protein [Streptomyces sp. Rer75]
MHGRSVVRTALATAAAAALVAGCRGETVTLDGQRHTRAEPRAGASTTSAAPRTPAAAPRPHRTFTHTPRATPRPATPPRTRVAAKPRSAPRVAPPVVAFGTSGERVRELQARLRQLGHFDRNPTGYFGTVTRASVASYQRARGLSATGSVDSRTWTSLRSRTTQPTRDELYPPTTNPLAKPDSRCLTGRVLCISKSSRTLAWMINGRVVSAMDVRFGSQYTPTREGLFQVNFKSRDHVSTIYDTPMPYAMFFSGGQAVHYSADFAARGYNGASHGCVNVRDKKKIAAVFNQVKAGDKVVVYK